MTDEEVEIHDIRMGEVEFDIVTVLNHKTIGAAAYLPYKENIEVMSEINSDRENDKLFKI